MNHVHIRLHGYLELSLSQSILELLLGMVISDLTRFGVTR